MKGSKYFEPKVRDHSLYRPTAMERLKNVRCTFLANRRAGARASCHPFQGTGSYPLPPQG